jgi:DNA-binding Lrp family transcriptional regulator
MSVQVYILIQTEVGKASSVAKSVSGIAGVTLAEGVTGPYDVIMRAEAPSMEELGRVILLKFKRYRNYPHSYLPRNYLLIS